MRLVPFLLALVMLPALAAGNPPPLLLKLESQGEGKIISSFQAVDGLTGWVIKAKGHYVVLYSTPSGNYVMGGALIGPDGVNQTQVYSNRYIPRPDIAALVSKLRKDAFMVDEGDAHAPEIFVYADPNCIFCNQLWMELRPFVKTGKVQVHWVMVGFLKSTSTGRAAAILNSSGRPGALALDEQQFDKRDEEGGIAELKPVPAELKAVIDAHTGQLSEMGNIGTPTILSRKHGQWTSSYGMPPDLKAMIADLSD
jgi:thiol:disulfide interchange protein DsbG